MANRPAPFSQADLTRALKAARAAGLELGRIEIEPGGRIIMIPSDKATMPATAGNTWDAVLS